MLKKFFTVILLVLAYAVLLGHSIVPHHHDDNAFTHQQHHKDGKLEDLFSHLQHYDKKDFCYLQTEHKEIAVESFPAILPKDLSFVFSLNYFVFRPYSAATQTSYAPPFFCFKPLRAPPSFYC